MRLKGVKFIVIIGGIIDKMLRDRNLDEKLPKKMLVGESISPIKKCYDFLKIILIIKYKQLGVFLLLKRYTFLKLFDRLGLFFYSVD